jgi:hypothetical protein
LSAIFPGYSSVEPQEAIRTVSFKIDAANRVHSQHAHHSRQNFMLGLPMHHLLGRSHPAMSIHLRNLALGLVGLQ